MEAHCFLHPLQQGSLGQQPYNWSMDWFSPPDPVEIGVQDLRTHGITFSTLAEEWHKDLLVKAHMLPSSAGNALQLVFNVDDTADPPCHTDVTTHANGRATSTMATTDGLGTI